MNATGAPFVLGLFHTGVLLIIFFALGAAKWIPRSRDEPYKYCERVRTDRMIRQPVNTWSSLMFIVFGLAILGWLSFAKAPRGAGNPMTVASGWAVVYALAVIGLGPGAMFLHASQKHWGGVLDNASMNMYLSWFLLYDLSRVFGGPPFGVALAIWLVLNAGLALWVFFKPDVNWIGIAQFVGLIGLLLLVELFGVVFGVFDPAGPRTEIDRALGWLLAGACCFGVAFLLWVLAGNNWSKYCKPDSVWQGHAAWHILGGVAAFLFYVYLRSERGA